MVDQCRGDKRLVQFQARPIFGLLKRSQGGEFEAQNILMCGEINSDEGGCGLLTPGYVVIRIG